MENAGNWEKNALLNELIQGRELALKLQVLDSSSSAEMREMLVQKTLTTFDRALSILKWNGLETETQPMEIVAGGMVDSPRSDSASPRSDDSDRPFKDQDRREISKKRKALPRWTEQVRIGSGVGLEGPLDGYGWRKYGQKDILGAKYPRAYYRCTHRNLQGCLATKQVQRSDEDPSVFDITYRGNHTCNRASHLVPASTSADKPEQKQNQDHLHPQELPNQQNQIQSQEILLNLNTGLNVQTNGLDSGEMMSSSFSFTSTSIGCLKTENHIFSPSTLDNNFMGSYSPSFISPATSESNYFSMSPCRMNRLQGGHNLQTSESDLTEIISAATSATNSPIVDLDFPLGPGDFDTNFPFDTSGFLL
ncbi:PREDICTED: probable WRKY transcription factor 41 [Nelumbo nucifera]|uniref:Probable WRKY transcription factor 41 n=1 Tax=Nelumbo nucifera TaxID=4432 RepID=A0A1U8AH56_NELNU|nr:PREDICTED: probable WRKY transcription factor 41 [Nelumbo nucifera]